jgi:oligoribonuclease NrnB/cAMP/cGMP phosphodiesterase (DHH superfamily)
MKKIYGLFHKRDLDGLASGAIVKRYARNSPDLLIFCDYDTFLDKFKLIFNKIQPTSELIIADISIDDHELEEFCPLLKKILEKCTIKWYDHHEWSKKKYSCIKPNVDELDISTEEEQKCAAEIVYENLMPNDDRSQKLAHLAHDQDFKINREEIANRLSDLITYRNYNNDLEHLANHLALAKDLWTKELESEWNEYIEIRADKIDQLINSTKQFQIKGYKFIFSWRNELISTGKAREVLREKFDSDVIITIEKRYLNFSRTYDNDFNCKKIAELFLGGGHTYSSERQLPFEVKTEADFKQAYDIIKKKIKKLLES